MATYAMMNGNIVSNIIVADSKEEAEKSLGCILIEYSEENPFGIGWIYNENTGEFTDPNTISKTEEEKKQALLEKLGITQEEFDLLSNN